MEDSSNVEVSSANKKKVGRPKKNKSVPPQPPLPPATRVNVDADAPILYAVPISWALPVNPPPKKVDEDIDMYVNDDDNDDDQVIDAEPLSQILPLPSPPPPKIENEISKRNDVTRKSRYFDGPMYGLPKGWLVETRERIPTVTDSVSVKDSKIRVDKFYYEPGTNKQFRSRTAVDAYLRLQSKMLEEGSSSVQGEEGGSSVHGAEGSSSVRGGPGQ